MQFQDEKFNRLYSKNLDNSLNIRKNKKKGARMVIAGFVLGIVSILMGMTGLGAIIFGAVGLPLSVIGLSKLKKNGMPTALGTAGLVMNIIGLGIGVLAVIITLIIGIAGIAGLGFMDWLDLLNY